MDKKTFVTIGIPAYNEAQNLRRLFDDICKQQTRTYTLKKVIVASDGSTDQTPTIVQTYKKLPLKLIHNAQRQGKASVLNQIVDHTKTEILVLLDADVRLQDKNFINKLIKPILTGKAHLSSARVEELPAKNFLQHVLATSMQMKKQMFEEYRNGQNLFTCHGRSRALARDFFSTLHFKNSASEDAFSYLMNKKHGFSYAYVKETVVWYELPKTLADHIKQSVRFFQHHNHLQASFTAQELNDAYFLPKDIVIRNMIKTLINHPIYLISYIIIGVIMKVQSFFLPVVSGAWKISETSKVLHQTKVV